ncbi:MAG: HD domain-containing protein [Clostridia bacterium]|nr:HD domain-containing protein [Clostridia bacterium]
MEIPIQVATALDILEAAGYDAYLVGGCVRDALIGRAVSDYDITTSADPSEVESAFASYKVIETGIKHGTVTVLIDSLPIEITTFRVDGDYRDLRHPERVSFSTNIEDDLARRDFTVNSMAMDKRGAIIDPYGGEDDAKRGIIRCTGDPDVRFNEDALRIIRALRFASVLGFSVERGTAESIHKNCKLLEKISVERVFSELKKLLCGKNVYNVLIDFSDVICTVIPELAPAVNFDHKSRYHIYDIYTHIAKTVENVEPDETLRLTMLFHDIGKPYSFTEEEGVRHYKGHPQVSAEIARARLEALHSDAETRRIVPLLCSVHDRTIAPTEKSVKKLFRTLTYDEIIMLCKVQTADAKAHAADSRERAKNAVVIMEIADEIRRAGDAVAVKDLAVNGFDLMKLGYEGKSIGEALERILDLVIGDELPNEKDRILEYLKQTR